MRNGLCPRPVSGCRSPPGPLGTLCAPSHLGWLEVGVFCAAPGLGDVQPLCLLVSVCDIFQNDSVEESSFGNFKENPLSPCGIRESCQKIVGITFRSRLLLPPLC